MPIWIDAELLEPQIEDYLKTKSVERNISGQVLMLKYPDPEQDNVMSEADRKIALVRAEFELRHAEGDSESSAHKLCHGLRKAMNKALSDQLDREIDQLDREIESDTAPDMTDNVHRFELRYLVEHDSELIERLACACSDAVAGIGQPGRIALDFMREGVTAAAAIRSALEDVERAAPSAVLIEVSYKAP